MFKTENITAVFIQKLSYPDFIGFINQWNTPPGSYSTLSKFATFSKITNQSHILEVACTTGFSSRELAVMTGCSGVGFDLSENSIKMANFNKKHYAPNINISYKVADGYTFEQQKKFTHIIVGGGLRFFSNPEKMLARCIEMMKDGGYILATPYYQTHQMPQILVQHTHNALGIPIEAFSYFMYKDIMKLFNKLEIIFEERNELVQETDEELAYYCKSVIDRACKIHKISNKKIYEAMYKKLFAIRKLINKGRSYQKYCVLVLRYRKSVYPNRFVALF